MSDLPFSTCKECGSKIERIITGGTGLIFKGSGFYLTDYKDEKKTDIDSTKQDKGNAGKTKTEKKKIESSKSEDKIISDKSTSKKAGNSNE